MNESKDEIEITSNFINNIYETEKPLECKNESFSSQIKSNLKIIYDYCKNQEIKKSTKSLALPELIIKEFDNEQIWQQLELQNEFILNNAASKLDTFSRNHNLIFDYPKKFDEKEEEIDELLEDENEDLNSENDDSINENEDENTDEEELDDEGLSDESDNELQPEKPKKNKKSVVDDEFFKLHEMEQFLEAEEKKINGDSGNEDLEESDSENDNDIDYFAEGSDNDGNDEARLMKYKQYFIQQEQPKKRKRNKFSDEENDNEEEEGEGFENQESTFEQRQKRLKDKIEELEDAAISDKPWQLQGEIKADSRPQNSLLEEMVEFDRASRPAPVITGQVTFKLEDLIKQRIKDKAFDSVERKQKPTDTPIEYRKKLVLDQEKSKASLAQIYEKEYLEQKAALDPENELKDEEEPESHKEIRKLMNTLFHQLDSLTNFFYTPTPAIPELKIISNVPAINMEEVAPVSTSDAALLAPEEVKSKTKSNILGKNERTSTDKKRERRKKKIKQKRHALLKEKRESTKKNLNKEESKKLLNKITKDKNIEKMDESKGKKGVKTSKAFFTQLQEQVQSQINSKSEPKKKKKKVVHDAKKLKL